MRQQHPEARVGLRLEQPVVHLVSFLEADAWITLHPINPITLQKYREAFVTSRAKDDSKDADYLADLLLTHADTRGPFWFHRPARILWIAVVSTQIIATLIAVYGLFMTPLGWGWALFVWGYALVWFLINDRLKLLAYRIAAPQTPALLAKKTVAAPNQPAVAWPSAHMMKKSSPSILTVNGGSSSIKFALIEDEAHDKLVSIGSLWEIAIKNNIGKLPLAKSFGQLIPEQLQRGVFEVLGLTAEHTGLLAQLPLHHRDPFDRMLVAQCLVENLPLVSRDDGLDAYGIKRLW